MCEMFDLSECEFLLKMRNQKVLFIATSWDCVADYSPDEMAEYDHIIVKYHPHVKDKNCFHEEKLHYISVNAPAEILIFKLLSQGCEVTFRSEFSSSMVYLLGTPVKIEFSKGVPDFIADFWEFVKSNQSHVCDSE